VHTLSLLAALPSLLFAGPATTMGLLAVVSVVTGTLLVVLVVHHAHGGQLDLLGSPIRRRVSALREQSRRAAFLRLRDPNARGRSRPRAPGLRSSAA
jgi:hypothetical protein